MCYLDKIIKIKIKNNKTKIKLFNLTNYDSPIAHTSLTSNISLLTNEDV